MSSAVFPNCLDKDPVYSAAAVRQLEQALMLAQQITDFELMQQVAAAMWRVVLQRWPQIKTLLVCCGAGNNGGDGYVLAYLAQQHGLHVSVLALAPLASLKGAAQLAAQQADAAGINIMLWNGALPAADVYIDALFGIGLQREVLGDYYACIAALNQQSSPVVAVDLPSGIHADTGAVLGIAVHATFTLTALVLKLGLFTGPAVDYVGELVLINSDLPSLKQLNDQALSSAVVPLAWRLNRWRPEPRPRSAHKGWHGHVLIVGGNYGMGGAVILAAEAALRAGAGLITVATRSAHIPALLARLPEVMTLALDQDDTTSINTALAGVLSNCSCIALGPGLGKQMWGQNLLAQILQADLPCVLDADALNLLAEHVPSQQLAQAQLAKAGLVKAQLAKPCQWILTPHPKEAARLLKCAVADVQNNRLAAVQRLSNQWQAVVVLKGAGSLIADSHQVQVLDCGNPGMAVAGMGDVLTGIIAGFLAQQLNGQHKDIFKAVAVAAWLHASAADALVVQQGMWGLRASDISASLPQFMHQLKHPSNVTGSGF